MQRQSFFIGSEEYQSTKIPAFEANEIILKLQRLILPVLGGLANGQSLGEMDVNQAFKIISERLDSSVMTDIVLPMFRLSATAKVSGKAIKIDSSKAINEAFGDADGLADMYELIFEVLRFNFASFFIRLMERFGNKDGTQSPAA